MKRFAFLLLIIPSVCLGEGPLFRTKDASAQQEFENVYQDLRSKHAFLTTNTSGQILISQGNGIAPIWGGGRTIQETQFSVTTATSSTSSTYIDSYLTGTITTQSSSIVEVYVTQSVQADAGNTLGIKILRDGITLFGPIVGVSGVDAIATLIYIDNPGSGSHTYKTQFARIGGAGTVRCQNNAVITNISAMLLKEISQ